MRSTLQEASAVHEQEEHGRPAVGTTIPGHDAGTRQTLPLPFPASVLCLYPLLYRGPFVLQGLGALFVLAPRVVQRLLSLYDQLSGRARSFFARRLLLAAFGIPAFLFAFEIRGRLA